MPCRSFYVLHQWKSPFEFIDIPLYQHVGSCFFFFFLSVDEVTSTTITLTHKLEGPEFEPRTPQKISSLTMLVPVVLGLMDHVASCLKDS